jgi:hypothetical protein
MLFCMRTTLDIDDTLHRRAKELAARTGRSLTSVIEDALRQALRDAERTSRRAPALPTSRPPGDAWGVRPGVDLDDSAALRDLMDGIDAPPRR